MSILDQDFFNKAQSKLRSILPGTIFSYLGEDCVIVDLHDNSDSPRWIVKVIAYCNSNDINQYKTAIKEHKKKGWIFPTVKWFEKIFDNNQPLYERIIKSIHNNADELKIDNSIFGNAKFHFDNNGIWTSTKNISRYYYTNSCDIRTLQLWTNIDKNLWDAEHIKHMALDFPTSYEIEKNDCQERLLVVVKKLPYKLYFI